MQTIYRLYVEDILSSDSVVVGDETSTTLTHIEKSYTNRHIQSNTDTFFIGHAITLTRIKRYGVSILKAILSN